MNMAFESSRTQAPPTKSSVGSYIVILGGGIIGLCTAYYLCESIGTGASIIIVDRALRLFEGASGKANGILGDYGYHPEVDDLGKLSYKLHRQLVKRYQGSTRWGYRDMMIYSCYREKSLEPSGNGLHHERRQPARWFDGSGKKFHTHLSGARHAARINPLEFCKFLRQCCIAKGVSIRLGATVSNAQIIDGKLKSVVISQHDMTFSVDCHDMVIATGPWSERVYRDLFPTSQVQIHSDVRSNSGNYMIIRGPGMDKVIEGECCHQFYLEGLFGRKVDISSRSDGSVYVGGSLSAEQDLPELATDVKAQQHSLQEMKNLAARALGCRSKDLMVLESGRAFRPVLKSHLPIVCQLPQYRLLKSHHQGSSSNVRSKTCGVFLALGHGSDGITLAPGTGKIISEMILEQTLSANVSGLNYR